MNTLQFKRRAGLEFLIFLSLVSITAAVLRPVEMYTGKKMGVLRDSFISMAESVLNRKIRYASASPSFAGSLDIRNVSVFREGEDPAMELDRFRLKYSLGALLTGKKTAAIRSVTIEGLRLVYDLDKDRDLADLFSGGEGEALVLPGECVLRLRDASILVKKGARELRINDLSFDGEVKDGRVILDGNWHTIADLTGAAKDFGTVTIDGTLNANFSSDLSDGNLTLGVSSMQTELFAIKNAHFNLSIHEHLVELVSERFNLRLAYDLDAEAFSGEFHPRDFALSEIIDLSGEWRRHSPWLDFRLTGDASFSSRRDAFVYRCAMAGEGKDAFLEGFDIDCSGDTAGVVFARCVLDFFRGTVSYTGDVRFSPLLPEGLIHFSDFNPAGSGSGISGDLRLIRSGRSLDIFAEDISVGGVLLSAVSGGVNWASAGFSWSLEMFRFRNIESYEDVELAALSINGSYDPSYGENRLPYLEGSAALDIFSLADIEAMLMPFFGAGFPFSKLTGKITVTTELFISTDFRHISYNAPRCVAVYEGLDDAFFVASISGTDERFEILDGRINWSKETAGLALQADFSDLKNIHVLVQAAYRDFTYYFDGVFLDTKTLSIRGSYGVSMYAAADDSGGYSGYINIASLPVPFQGKTARLSVDVSASFDSLSFWTVDINHLEFRETENPVQQFTHVLVSGQLNQSGFVFEKLFYADKFGELSGSLKGEWERDFSRAKGVFVLSDGNSEYYAAEASYSSDGQAFVFDSDKKGKIAFYTRINGMRLGRFSGGNPRLSGTADGVWNSMDSYAVTLNLASLEIPGEYGSEVFLSGSGFIDDRNILVSASDLKIGGIGVPAFTLAADRSLSLLEMKGNLLGSLDGRSAALDGSVRIAFAPVDSWFAIEKALRSFSGTFSVESASMGPEKLAEPCSFSFSRTRTANGAYDLVVSGGPGDMLRLEHLADGSLYLDLSSPSPVQAYVTGTMKDFYLDVMVNDMFVDLSGLWALVPVEKVIFTGGFITGNTRISGSLWDPEFSGKAWGSSVRLTIPGYVQAEIGPGSDIIILEGSEIYFGPVKARCGNGYGEVSCSFRFNRWVPSYDILVYVPEDGPIPFGFDISGFKAKGIASGNINFYVENNETLTISGDITADDTEITLNTEEIQAAKNTLLLPGEYEIVANMRIEAGRRLEFMWPDENLPVLRAYAAAGSAITIVSDDRVPMFTIDGDITLQGGEIFYIQRSFFIRNGKVFFNPNDPDPDPYISARAEIQDRTNEGDVVISMIIDYSPLSSLLPRFESNPPLSQLEIYSLLGQVPAEGQGQGEMVIKTLGDLLTQFAITRRVERSIRNALGLDMFTVRTQVLQNALLQAVNTQDDTAANTAAGMSPENNTRGSKIGNYLDNTAVYMGKYLAPDLFIRLRASARYNEYQEAYGGLRMEPDLGIEMKTPLAGVQWNLSPRHFEDFGVGDMVIGQSFSLIWRWTF